MNKLNPLLIAVICAFPMTGNAQIVQNAIDTVSKAVAPKESSAPINVIRREEAWGDSAVSTHRDPMPFRGRPEQMADERKIDDRFVDKNEPLRKKPAKVVLEPKATAVGTAVAKAPKPTTTFDEQGVCVNVQKVWDSSAYLSQQGNPEKAYAAYLRLFKTCTTDNELAGTAWQATKNLPQEYVEKLLTEEALQAPKTQEASFALKSGLIYQYNKQKLDDKIAVLAPSVKSLALEKKDANLLGILGWVSQRAKSYKEAESLFRSSLRIDATNDANREGLAYALLAQNKLIQASPEIDKLQGDSLVAAKASWFLASAREAYKDKQYKVALANLESAQKYGAQDDASTMALRAWAMKNTNQAPEAADIFKELLKSDPNNMEYSAGYTESIIASGDGAKIKELAKNPPIGQEKRVNDAMAGLLIAQGRADKARELTGKKYEQSLNNVAIGAGVKVKTGEAGQDKLTLTLTPEGSGSIEIAGGVLEATAAKVRVDDNVQAANGYEGRVQYTTNVGNDGRLKLGGGLSRVAGDNRLTIDSSYRLYTDSGFVEGGLVVSPVMDTVQSYAGKYIKTETGKPSLLSGRAMESKVNLNGTTTIMDDYKLTWAGNVGSIGGKNFSNTSFFDARAALTKDFNVKGYSWLALGPELRLAQYTQDQNRWTAGYGGFYSPLSEMGAGLRYSAMTEEGGRMLFKSTGFAGMMRKEFYSSSSSSAVVEVDATAAFLIGPHLIAKGGLSFKNSAGYNELGVTAGLEFTFDPRTKLFANDLGNALKILK